MSILVGFHTTQRDHQIGLFIIVVLIKKFSAHYNDLQQDPQIGAVIIVVLINNCAAQYKDIFSTNLSTSCLAEISAW